MFLYNRGHFSSIDNVNPDGVVLCTSSLEYSKFLRRTDDYDVEMVLLDPQVYLWSIDCQQCQRTYGKISSYPWVKTAKGRTGAVQKLGNQGAAQSSKILTLETDQEIKACIKECLETQKKFGATHLIIPTPLAIAREDQFSEQLKWLQLASAFSAEYKEPFLATIALSDETLLNCKFEDNVMLQTILDNAAVMSHIDGYYIVVERDANSVQITEINIARALLELTYNLGYCQEKEVVINFADVFGLICIAVGASAFGGGYTTKERRLNFGDFVERNGGMSLPKYYSSNLLGDFYSERDLNKIVDLRLLRYITSDITTSHSNLLINGLKSKVPVKSIAAWKETRSNTGAAAKHRVDCLAEQTKQLMYINDIEDRIGMIFTLIQEAESRMEYLKSRLKDDPINEDGRHLSVWRKALEEFMDTNGIVL